ncbi:XcyI family restriction endonuclease [Coleofasciculus sp. FACHB-SPT36]|uniref:XcyI family restriction endonuclease n=1 Tax=Cyanophyceae TaxID=3028117 RepID=UPI00168BF1B6|nr:XcyI family restriction endonuclease [Coleofasciculus sp. FACHB-SPT36]MBD2539213.1 XcyI family restriction endonuclease [Coleofasciculus sp. FACHB-SPT36]
MLEVAYQIEQVKGETLLWDCENLVISKTAWNKVIHRGIKPVIIFSHPQVLMSISRAVSYYRMLAMVSQKSMSQVGLQCINYEKGNVLPNEQVADRITQHLNKIISLLVEADEQINQREFDLWRGMAAGSQAQGSWQNSKGNKIEILIQAMLRRRLREENWVSMESADDFRIVLTDGRTIAFADEPDIAVYQDDKIVAAVEIKGGIDKAGVLERIGAAIKSLSRAKEANSVSTTILVLQGVSFTPQARDDLRTNQSLVNYWFTVEEVLQDEEKKEELFRLLDI